MLRLYHLLGTGVEQFVEGSAVGNVGILKEHMAGLLKSTDH